MAVLHLTVQGAEAHVRGDTVEIKCEGQRIGMARVPLLSTVVVHGVVHLSTPLITRLLGAGVDVVYLSSHGRFRGRLETFGSKAASLRVRQYELASRERVRRGIGLAIVSNKLASQWRVLTAMRASWPRDPHWFLTRLAETDSLDEIRGIEGYATKSYFAALREVLGPGYRSWARKRRPPPDGLNALLSYGYAILQTRVHAGVCTVGLDPYTGFLHGAGRPRPGLVLDVMEEFRAPLVDLSVVRLVRSLPNEGWWDRAQGGVRLGDEAKKALIAALEGRFQRRIVHRPTGERVTVERAIEYQVRGLVGALTGTGRQYQAYGGWPRGVAVRRGV